MYDIILSHADILFQIRFELFTICSSWIVSNFWKLMNFVLVKVAYVFSKNDSPVLKSMAIAETIKSVLQKACL